MLGAAASGGISVEDDWPRGAYLLVRLTRDRVRHTRALRRLARFSRHLRTVRVEVNERELIGLQDRIDRRAAEADGFVIVVSVPSIDSGAVELDVITRRTDPSRVLPRPLRPARGRARHRH